MQQTRSTMDVCRLCGADAAVWVTAPLQLRRGSRAAETGGRIRQRRYVRCPVCDQIQCHSDDLPAPDEESERYEEHNNTLSDRRYREYLEGFLDAAVEPYVSRAAVSGSTVSGGAVSGGDLEHDGGTGRTHRGSNYGAAILDFGSGPEPALARLMEERGYRVSIYDPFYAADESVLAGADTTGPGSPDSPDTIGPDTDGPGRRYDAITAVEVVEHLFFPGTELERLVSLVRTGGILAVRTGVFAGGIEDFQKWWYRRDISHVSFWTDKSIQWICNTYKLEQVYRGPGDILVFLRR